MKKRKKKILKIHTYTDTKSRIYRTDFRWQYSRCLHLCWACHLCS